VRAELQRPENIRWNACPARCLFLAHLPQHRKVAGNRQARGKGCAVLQSDFINRDLMG